MTSFRGNFRCWQRLLPGPVELQIRIAEHWEATSRTRLLQPIPCRVACVRRRSDSDIGARRATSGLSNFHSGYKQTALAADELIRDISLPRRFSEYVSHSRKVGAATRKRFPRLPRRFGPNRERHDSDVRLALGSVAPIPLRLNETERALTEKRIEPSLIDTARKSLVKEICPIDDIRSTARYRAAVAGNLVAEFLEKLAAAGANA